MKASELRVGDTVRAFHPAMFGVIRTGVIRKIGNSLVHIDFGILGGGRFYVRPEDITVVIEREES